MMRVGVCTAAFHPHHQDNSLKIRTFEAFRGLLALWVVIGHTIKHSGYDLNRLGVFKLLAMPEKAVDCFIMLSGFVIFFLLDARHVSYGEFITRRLFRLAPLYLAVLVASALSLGWQSSVIQAYLWKNITTAHDLALHVDAMNHLATQFVAHLTMLHGLIPDSILPSSQFAIVGQAWSISVEWQFYLIAPLLFAMIARGRWRALACALLVLCGLRASNYGGEGFAVNQGLYFLIGILSYYLWKRFGATPEARADFIEASAVIVMAFAYLAVPGSFSLVIWAVMTAVAFAETCGLRRGICATIGQVLCRKPFQFLGRISYSMYMTHMLVLYAWSAIFTLFVPSMDKPQFLVLNIFAVVAVTVVLSAVCYGLIEAPGMKLGSLLVNRMIRNTKTTPREAVHGSVTK